MTVEHTDVAAYSLGLLEPSDKLDFEAHLASCESCAAELAEFSAMAELFEGMGQLDLTNDEPDENAITDLVSRRAAALRRRSWQRSVLVAAACVVLLAAGVFAGFSTAPRSSGSAVTPTLAGALHKATSPASGITGTVGLVAMPWGTRVTLQLGKVKGPLDCELIAVSRTGEQRVMVGWLVPAAGYGVPGHPADLLIAGGTSISMDNLAAIKVVVVNGRTLLSIPI